MMSAYVYMLRCEDESFYIGWTTNVEKRFLQHCKGKGAKYTKSHRPVEVVFQKMFATKREAMQWEYQMKQLTHTQKKELIIKNSNTF